MATKLTKKQQGELTEKLTGIIQKNNALQLRLSMDRSVNEMNVSQISGALNRIHGQAIGKELPTEISIPPSFAGYEINGIGTVYGGDLNIETGVLTVTNGGVDLGTLDWTYRATGYNSKPFLSNINNLKLPASSTTVVPALISSDRYSLIRTNAMNNAAVDRVFGFGFYFSGVQNIQFIDNEYSDAVEFKSSLSGVYLVYELETPETYTLTPEQMIQLLDQL